MTVTKPWDCVGLSPAAAWSQRVRKVGGYLQVAFAAFWLIRGGLSAGGNVGATLAVAGLLVSLAVLVYAIRVTAGTGHRPTGPRSQAHRTFRDRGDCHRAGRVVRVPSIVIAMGHSDWVLPSIAITIGPLLLWLDHLVHIPRLRLVGWALTVGPFILVAVLSGSALAATTGLAAGVILLSTATAGFHDLASVRPQRPSKTVDVDPHPTHA